MSFRLHHQRFDQTELLGMIKKDGGRGAGTAEGDVKVVVETEVGIKRLLIEIRRRSNYLNFAQIRSSMSKKSTNKL